MTRPYVTEVTSNIKCGVSAKLGQKTLILGPKGSGKSTHVNAIELALTGRASDIAGRVLMAKDSDLWQLAPKGVESIFTQVKWSDRSESRWDLTLGKRGKLVNAVPDAFSLQDVRAALLGSAETARKFMLSQLSPEKFHWRGVIPESLREKFKADMQRPLIELLEHAKRRARELVSEQEEHDRLARSMAAGLPPEGVNQPSTQVDDREIKGEIEAYKSELEKLNAQIKELEAQLVALPEVTIDDEQAELLKAVADVMDWHLKSKAEACLICGGGTLASSLVAHVQQRRDKIRAKVEGQLEVSKKREQVRAQINEAQRKLPLINSQIRALELELAAINQPKSTTWAEVKQHQEKALSCKADAAEWKSLAEYCALALKGCLVQAKEDFEKKVQSYLPENQKFALELNHGESEVFRFGLKDGDHVRYALSKGEEAMVLCAMSMVLSKADGPSIIVPPETGWDPVGLAETLQGWNGTDHQVIVTSTVEPSTIPEGWTVIRMTGEKSSVAQPQTQIMSWPDEKRGRKSRKKAADALVQETEQLGLYEEKQEVKPEAQVDPNSLF